MYRIGIIGTENSHTSAFAKYFNVDKRQSDMQVTLLYGPDGNAQKVSEIGGGIEIAGDVSEFIGRVDAAILCSRRGSVHLRYAEPLIRAGIPMFIDKPMTSDPVQARALARLAQEHGVALCGGSGCVFAPQIAELGEAARQMRVKGELLSAALNFSADTQSEYDGFYFYAPHLTEMVLELFDTDMQSVYAVQNNGGVSVLGKYADICVSMHYTKGSKASTAVLFGRDANMCADIDISGIYEAEASAFADMVRTGRMRVPYERMVRPVEIIDAILRSLNTKQEVLLP